MKRLTYRDANGEAWYSDVGTERDRLHRLAAYEDTGLEPGEVNAVAGLASENCAKTADKIDQLLSDDKELEEYRALGPIDRLRELAQSDREGRCVVLPCKAGDTVWVINHHLSKIFENKIVKFSIGSKSDNKNYITTLYLGKCGTTSIRRWKLQQIGKTVFLTREEAEAALEGMS